MEILLELIGFTNDARDTPSGVPKAFPLNRTRSEGRSLRGTPGDHGPDGIVSMSSPSCSRSVSSGNRLAKECSPRSSSQPAP